MKLPEGIEIVWIDLDDTLWDFHGNSRIALTKIYEELNLSEYFQSCESWITKYETVNHSLWDQYNRGAIEKEYLMSERFRRPLADAGHPDATVIGAYLDTHYLDLLADCTGLVDGASDLLRRLKSSGYKTGILSNGFTEVQHRKIKNSGLSPWIDYTVLSDEIGVNKPDRRIYEYAQKISCKKSPLAHLMIGDNPDTDIAGANAAGWHSIYYNREGKGDISRLCEIDL